MRLPHGQVYQAPRLPLREETQDHARPDPCTCDGEGCRECAHPYDPAPIPIQTAKKWKAGVKK